MAEIEIDVREFADSGGVWISMEMGIGKNGLSVYFKKRLTLSEAQDLAMKILAVVDEIRYKDLMKEG